MELPLSSFTPRYNKTHLKNGGSGHVLSQKEAEKAHCNKTMMILRAASIVRYLVKQIGDLERRNLNNSVRLRFPHK